MQEPDFSEHPAVQAIDAAIDALTYLREGGTKMMPVSPDVWQHFIAAPAPTRPQSVSRASAPMPTLPAPSRAEHAAASQQHITPEEQTEAHRTLTALIQQCQNCAYASETRFIGHGTCYHPRILVVNGACLAGDTPMAIGSRLEGDSGELLWKMFAAIGISKDDVYITSPLKCPVTGRPDPKCLQACAIHLQKEIHLVHPDVIVMLGDIAAKAVMSNSIAATEKVGVWHLSADDIPAIKLYHPMRILLLNDQLARPLKQENWEALKRLQMHLQSSDTPHA
ncbi:MAG: uracil-DNA glycosylase [Kiritimatiellae bacterium]|nr:uracil-DNA glycosylase [Kiritimatiellia bacterium]